MSTATNPLADDFARVAQMLSNLESRLETTIAVQRSIVRGTDPDSPDGREAREMLVRLTRMLDQLGGLS